MISVGVIVGTLFVVSVTAYTGPLMCLRYCGNVERQPICGYNGKELKIFENSCELKNAECGDRSAWIEKNMIECFSFAAKSPKPSFDSNPMSAVYPVASWNPKPILEPEEMVHPYPPNPYPFPFSQDSDDVNAPAAVSKPAKKQHSSLFLNKLQPNRKKHHSRTDICDMACPEYYLPVCGFDGQSYKTFSNMCFMQQANCNRQSLFKPSNADNCLFQS